MTVTQPLLIALILALGLVQGALAEMGSSELELQKQAGQNAKTCQAPPRANQAQFIVGYGSLMQKASRERTAPKAGRALPIEVLGYRRGWFAAGTNPGFDTTYLGAVTSKGDAFNAVLFEIPVGDIPGMDERESFYCRVELSPSEIQPLAPKEALPPGQYWMYLNGPHSIGLASAEKPIVESYVDIFIGGCLSIEKEFALEGFTRRCIESTSDWSEHWVNDRIYPRRPFIYQPQAMAIDGALKSELPTLFSKIKIE